MIELDLTPDVTIVQSIRAEAKMNLTEACAEFIDNSLDAGATLIEIQISPSEIIISDNGRGCSDLQRMLKLGVHNPDGRRIGRYGVGFNSAAIWLGRSVSVDSVCRGKRYRASLTWDDIQPGWKVSGPEPEESRDPSGARIRVYDLIPRKMPLIDGMVARAAARYPALGSAGKKILINGSTVPGVELPEITDSIRACSEWEGRAYRLTAGLARNVCQPWKYGFTVMLRDRVLSEGVSDGCGEYSRHGFFALVELLEGVELEDGTISAAWPVDKTKTGMTDTMRLFLDSLFPAVEHLLKAAETETSNIVLRGLESQLSGGWLNDALFGVCGRERRTPGGGRPGTVEPTGTGSKRKTATNVEEDPFGSIKLGRGVGRTVRVKFADLGTDSDIAAVSHNSARTECILNEAHPFVRENRDLGLLQTKLLVAQMVITHWLDDGSNVRSRIVNQLSLPLDGPRFEEVQRAMGRVLRHLSDGNSKETQ